MEAKECAVCGEETLGLRICVVCGDMLCKDCRVLDPRVNGFVCTSCLEVKREVLEEKQGGASCGQFGI